jgi:hypothetical protein
MITCLPSYVLPGTEQLLVSGGDERIALDSFKQSNRYGCHAVHKAGLVSFGSSTASSISEPAYARAEALREEMARQLHGTPPAEVYGREMQRLREELLAACRLEGQAELIFAASGTDLHMIAAQLAASAAHAEGVGLQIIMVNPEESGSGVPAALAGRHFSALTARGDTVEKNSPLQQALLPVAHLAIRDEDGGPRAAASIDAEAQSLAEAAIQAGHHVLLVMTDVSKTGSIAPSAHCALEMQRRWAGRLQVMVDACQFRLAPPSLKAYLQQGCMLALTGSKFVTGPTFSGALLLPNGLAARWRQTAQLRALRQYALRQEWPANWPAAHSLDSACNFGLLLRWEAALHELRAFYAVPAGRVRHLMQRFADRVQQRLQDDRHFEALPSLPLARPGISFADSWDLVQTIHPFVLYRVQGANRQALSREDTRQLYWRLQETEGQPPTAPAYQVGQPVECGQRDGAPASALRISLSARQVAQALGGGQQDWGDSLLEQAMQCCDRIVELI